MTLHAATLDNGTVHQFTFDEDVQDLDEILLEAGLDPYALETPVFVSQTSEFDAYCALQIHFIKAAQHPS